MAPSATISSVKQAISEYFGVSLSMLIHDKTTSDEPQDLSAKPLIGAPTSWPLVDETSTIERSAVRDGTTLWGLLSIEPAIERLLSIEPDGDEVRCLQI